jgi:hypothetical protein
MHTSPQRCVLWPWKGCGTCEQNRCQKMFTLNSGVYTVYYYWWIKIFEHVVLHVLWKSTYSYYVFDCVTVVKRKLEHYVLYIQVSIPNWIPHLFITVMLAFDISESYYCCDLKYFVSYFEGKLFIAKIGTNIKSSINCASKGGCFT